MSLSDAAAPERRRPRSVAVVGAGALGQSYSAALARADVAATLVASPSAAAQVLARGELRLRGALDANVAVGERAAPGRVGVVVGALGEPVDGIIFATKIHDLAAAAQAARAWGADWVLGVQNGLVKDDLLCAIFGDKRVLGGTTTLAAQRQDDGAVQIASTGVTFVGPYRQAPAARAVEVVDLLVSAGLRAELVVDPSAVEWAKVLQAAPAFAVQMIVRDSAVQLWADPVQARAALIVMREIAEIAQAGGVVIRDFAMLPSARDLAEDEATVLNRRRAAVGAWADGQPFRSSLLQDLLAGRPTEAGHIFADLVRRADAAHVAAPVLRFVATLAERL